jgi:hypothetical protein
VPIASAVSPRRPRGRGTRQALGRDRVPDRREDALLHIASIMLLTFYRVAAKRGSLLINLTGIVVHDHWKPYYTLTGVLHALCNAHTCAS